MIFSECLVESLLVATNGPGITFGQDQLSHDRPISAERKQRILYPKYGKKNINL